MYIFFYDFNLNAIDIHSFYQKTRLNISINELYRSIFDFINRKNTAI